MIFSVGSSSCTITTWCPLPKTGRQAPASEPAALRLGNIKSVSNENHHAWTERAMGEEAFSSFGRLWESENLWLGLKRESQLLIWFSL